MTYTQLVLALKRRGFSQLSAVLVAPCTVPSMSSAAALILVGLRELTAQTVEDGGPVAEMIETGSGGSVGVGGWLGFGTNCRASFIDRIRCKGSRR